MLQRCHPYLVLNYDQVWNDLSRITLLPKATGVLGGKEEMKVTAGFSQNVHDYIFTCNCFGREVSVERRGVGDSELGSARTLAAARQPQFLQLVGQHKW